MRARINDQTKTVGHRSAADFTFRFSLARK
jgi:chemotaxis response regulator CheB